MDERNIARIEMFKNLIENNKGILVTEQRQRERERGRERQRQTDRQTKRTVRKKNSW